MKNKSMLLIVLMLMIITIFIIGCSSKEYKITIYIMNSTEEPGFPTNWEGEHFDDILWVKLFTTEKNYYASEIIDYSGTSIRFVDSSTGMERFVSADFIEVTQTK